MSSSLLLHASVQYRALAEKASDVIKATVPKLNLDDAFEQKNGIAKAVVDELEKAMSTYGYEMVLVTQYFDTVKKIGASSKSSSVFTPHGPGALRDVAAQIRGLLLGSTH